MTDISTFTSRPARLNCKTRDFYDFVTDVNNLSRFISSEVFPDLTFGRESLSFTANMLGTVRLYLSDKVEYSRVAYRGENSQVQDFLLTADISETESGTAKVVITLSAVLNPMLKMLAAAPVKRLLDTVADGMEGFKGWNEAGSQNQSL